MEFTAFEILGTELRAKEESLFADYSNEDLIELKKDVAKEDLKWDLVLSLQLEIEDTDLETYLDHNVNFLRETLAFKQLFWYFMENDGGEGTINNSRMKYYDKRYKDNVKLFKSLQNNTEIPATINISIRR